MNAVDPTAGPAQVDVLRLRDYFYGFVKHNSLSLELHDCLYEACDLYEAAILGEMPGYEYFVINMPRRIGKTKLLQAVASWVFGEFEDAQQLYGCYSDQLVVRSIAYVALTMQRPWYIDLYGDKIHSAKANLITTTAGGSLYGAGTTATIAGFGAGLKEPAGGLITLDDPAKPDEAGSKVETANVIENFEITWKGCRNSDKFTPIVINAQRIGPDDLPGYLIKTYPNKTFVLKFPCFVSGKSQFPETWSDQTMVDLLKTRIGRYVLASQFQQEPVAMGGNLIMVDKFMRYDREEARVIDWEEIAITCDTALKTKEANDFSCVQAWGRAVRRAYLMDAAHGKWESPQLFTVVSEFFQKIRASYPLAPIRLVIEEKAAGSGLIQQLNAAGIPAEGIERDIDKVRRVQAVMPYQETGLVYIPKSEPTDDSDWVNSFVNECAEFKADMTHKHDDWVDPFADGVSILLGDSPSILELMGARPRQ